VRFTTQGTFETFNVKTMQSKKTGKDFLVGEVILNIVNKKLDYETETFEDMDPVPVPFKVMGKLAEQIQTLPYGAVCEVVFEVSGREYQGKYFSEIRAFKVSQVDVAEDQKPANPPKKKEDDAQIPF
jgi:hypothetical protein